MRSQSTLATVCVAAAAVMLSISVGAAASTATWKIPAVLLALACIVVLGIEKPALFISAVLIVRPLLDSSSESKIHIGLGALNLGGALGLCVLVVAVGYLFATKRITLPTLSLAFATVFAFSAVMAIEARANFGPSAGTSAVTELIRLAAIFAIFVLAANVASSPSSVRRMFAIFALSAAIPALIAIFQFATGGALAPSGLLIERAFGTFSGPNPLGEYSAICALILICAPADLMSRSIRIIALAVILGALAISYSRAGYAMFLIGVIAIEYRRVSHKLVWLAAALAIVLIAVPTVRNRILPTGTTAASIERVYAKTGETGLLAGNGTYGSFGWRLYNWGKLLNKWEASPALGFGLQTTVLVNPLHQRQPNGAVQGILAHNTAVRALVEGGVIMLLVWIYFCARLIGSSARAKNERWKLQPYARILWGIWIAIVVIGFATDDPFSGTALMYGCVALTGALQAAYRRHRMALVPAPVPRRMTIAHKAAPG
jgi:O-antigen ligase